MLGLGSVLAGAVLTGVSAGVGLTSGLAGASFGVTLASPLATVVVSAGFGVESDMVWSAAAEAALSVAGVRWAPLLQAVPASTNPVRNTARTLLVCSMY